MLGQCKDARVVPQSENIGRGLTRGAWWQQSIQLYEFTADYIVDNGAWDISPECDIAIGGTHKLRATGVTVLTDVTDKLLLEANVIEIEGRPSRDVPASGITARLSNRSMRSTRGWMAALMAWARSLVEFCGAVTTSGGGARALALDGLEERLGGILILVKAAVHLSE